MDVRMPDGTIIQNVPDNVTQQQVMQLYQSKMGGGQTQQPQAQPMQQPQIDTSSEAYKFANRPNPIVGFGEPGAMAPIAEGGFLGFAGELGGGIKSGIDWLAAKAQGKDIPIGQLYDVNRAVMEGQLKQYQQQNPLSSLALETASSIPTSLLLPGAKAASLPGMMGYGAGLGATYSAGKAETMADVPSEALKGAAIGAAVPVVTNYISKIGRNLITKSAKQYLNESAPTIDGLKQAARNIYQEIDDIGAKINANGTQNLSNELNSVIRKQGFNATIHPKVNAALNEFSSIAGKPQSLSEIDTLRRVAQAAARSSEPDEARLGTLMVNKIDDFLNSAGKKDFTIAGPEIAAKYKDARFLWRRVKKSEMIQDAFEKAKLQASGFENGIRTQFRAILNSKKKSQGFTPDEISAMREVVKGTTAQNITKMLGRFGFSEGQASNMLMGSLGVAGGAAIGGPAGAVAVPVAGQASRMLSQKLTRESAKNVDLLIRAGNNALDITKAYMKAVPAKQRSSEELARILMSRNANVGQLQNLANTVTDKGIKKMILDSILITNAAKAQQENK